MPTSGLGVLEAWQSGDERGNNGAGPRAQRQTGAGWGPSGRWFKSSRPDCRKHALEKGFGCTCSSTVVGF